jgi:hypothetical protein
MIEGFYRDGTRVCAAEASRQVRWRRGSAAQCAHVPVSQGTHNTKALETILPRRTG